MRGEAIFARRATLLALFMFAAAPAQACRLGLLADLPIRLVDSQPLVAATIDGRPASFVLDSGAGYSVMAPGAARRFDLMVHPLREEMSVFGVGGYTGIRAADVAHFVVGSTDLGSVEFEVSDHDIGQGVAGVIGQNLLHAADVDYDLAGGHVKLMRPHDCERAALAYWATDGDYGTVPIDWGNAADRHTIVTVLVNGRPMRAILDTGASFTFLSLDAAAQLGVRPGGLDVRSDDLAAGFGAQTVKTWSAPFASFQFGPETIRNVRLRIGDLSLIGADMLLGEDFFRAHRLYVANGQHRIYFTYNGAPVFAAETPKVAPR